MRVVAGRLKLERDLSLVASRANRESAQPDSLDGALGQERCRIDPDPACVERGRDGRWPSIRWSWLEFECPVQRRHVDHARSRAGLSTRIAPRTVSGTPDATS